MTGPGVLLFFLWAVAVPFFSGVLPVMLVPESERTIGKTFWYGQLLTWTLFDLIAVPVLIFGNVFISFNTLCGIVPWVLGAAALMGLGILIVKKPLTLPGKKTGQTDPETLIVTGIFLILLFGQLYMAWTRASFDGDDAYYVVESVMSDHTGTMYNYIPYTGESTTLDIRHALAVVPMWEAFLARMSGIHAAAVAHTLLPLVLIPLSYLLILGIGRYLFADQKQLIPAFLIVVSLFRIFGNTSIYTAETFFLTRTWQGKSMMANLVVPGILLCFLPLFKEAHAGAENGRAAAKKERGVWVMLALTHVFAGMCTSMGVVLGAGLSLLLAASLSLMKKNPRALLYGALSCLPNAVYLLLYRQLH